MNTNAEYELEPDGGNMYHPHVMQVNSGQFWRCAHGLTGFETNFNGDLKFVGCVSCACDDIDAYIKFTNDQSE